MIKYKNLSGQSGVESYEPGRDYIRVRFVDGTLYVYTEGSVGREAILQMKLLAAVGRGLSTYISRFVREKYAQKEEEGNGSV